MTAAGCTSVLPVPGTVVFSATEFLATYPEFAAVDTAAPSALQNNFNNATVMLNNSCCSRVVDVGTRQQLLYLLTAHLTALFQGVNNQGPVGIVGRISQATQGSIAVTAEWSSTVGQSQAFFVTTTYGALYWQMTASYRTMTYVPAPQVNYGAYPGYGGFIGGPGYGPWNGGCCG